jgi:pilus assembly protein CpaB
VSRRARAVAMLGLSLACAGFAASLVNGYAREVEAQVGALAPVVVAVERVPRGKLITPAMSATHLAIRRVPGSYVPPDAFRSTGDALGQRALTDIPAGSYVGSAQIEPAGARRPGQATGLEAGGRLIQVPVAGAAALGAALRPGIRVDLLVTSERGPGPPRTYLALQRIDLLDFRPSSADASLGNGEGRAPDGVATLRVTLRQAVLLTAAQNFARELRLVARRGNDERLLPPTSVTAHDLHP